MPPGPKALFSFSWEGDRRTWTFSTPNHASRTIKKIPIKLPNVIRDAAIAAGMTTMRHVGERLIRDGITTVEEVLHATREN